jgi:hypothetical protein
MIRYFRIDYQVKPDTDLEQMKSAIKKFVDGIRAHHPHHRYISCQSTADPRCFTHLGEVVEDVIPDLQKQPFFLQFTGYLRDQCSCGPDATRLSRVASTVEEDSDPRLSTQREADS